MHKTISLTHFVLGVILLCQWFRSTACPAAVKRARYIVIDTYLLYIEFS